MNTAGLINQINEVSLLILLSWLISLPIWFSAFVFLQFRKRNFLFSQFAFGILWVCFGSLNMESILYGIGLFILWAFLSRWLCHKAKVKEEGFSPVANRYLYWYKLPVVTPVLILLLDVTAMLFKSDRTKMAFISWGMFCFTIWSFHYLRKRILLTALPVRFFEVGLKEDLEGK